MIKSLKICGISDQKTLKFIINHKYRPKMIGFVANWEASKRYVKFDELKKLININKKKVNFVAILVKPSNRILEKIKNLNFDYYQLYDVNPKRTKEIKSKYKIKIITAITVSNQNDVDKYKYYSEISDIILFDSKGYHKSQSFDHSLLDQVPKELNKMIAGNIQIEDIPTFKNKDFIIDLSGSVEDNKGRKDINKIDRLLNMCAKYEN